MKQYPLNFLFLSTCVILQLSANAQQSLSSKVNYDSLRTVLEAMLESDQNIRRILVDSVGLDSPEAPKYMYKMSVIDAENKAKIELILEKYGWIGKSKIGEKAAEGIFYVVQHTDLLFMEKYFPQFKLLAEQGEANAALCAMMEDILLLARKLIRGRSLRPGSIATGSLCDRRTPRPSIGRRQKKTSQRSLALFHFSSLSC